MTGQGVRWTAEEVLALAPDDASRRAGSKLSSPAPWSEAASGDGAVWGLCKGSGKTPYRTVVDLGGGTGGTDGPGYKCSCPSRKFPCKHALGLLLLWSGEGAQAAAEPPEWAGDWLAGRRERAARKAESASQPDPAGTGQGGGPSDPEGARRRAERRWQRVTAGATELEERLADLLRGGLAGAERSGHAQWEETASRMVDAQAPGLAARARELGALPLTGGSGIAGSPAADVMTGGSGGWPARMLSECALLHLLNQGVLAVDTLPEPLAATVRTRAGLTVDSAEVLAGDDKVRDEWLVLAWHDTDDGRLTARRVWLHGLKSGRPALLLSYGTGQRAPALALPAPVGSTFDGELAFHPGAQPLRAVLGERHGQPAAGPVPEGGPVTEALASYGRALCGDPWLESWPAVLSAVVPTLDEHGGGIRQLADADGEFALPIAPGTASSALWRLLAISGGGPVTVFGECGHRGFTPYTAWSEARALPL
jgi:hypothetical protein